MKDNRGFATSFILFSLLILFLLIMGVLLFTLGNSSVLTSKLKDKLVTDIENPNEYNEYDFYYTGSIQTFTAPRDRTYSVEAWSANNGAYTIGKIYLKKNEKLYLFVGSKNGYNNGSTDVRLIYGNLNDQESVDSKIMYAGSTVANSYISGHPGLTNHSSGKIFTSTDIKENSTLTPEEQNLDKTGNGYIRIIYYSISAANLGYDNTTTGVSCDNVQCVLEKISKMLK